MQQKRGSSPLTVYSIDSLYIHYIQLTQINRVTSSVTGDSEWGRTEVKGQTGTACFSSRAFSCLDDDAIGCWTAGLLDCWTVPSESRLHLPAPLRFGVHLPCAGNHRTGARRRQQRVGEAGSEPK